MRPRAIREPVPGPTLSHLWTLQVKRELDRAATTAAQLATTDPRDLVQSHRSLVCNADDELRMACVPTHSSDPNGPIDNFRGMPGVVVHGRPGGSALRHAWCVCVGRVRLEEPCANSGSPRTVGTALHRPLFVAFRMC